MAKSLDRVSPTDIETFKEWIATNSTIAKAETAFLNQEADLGIITSQPQNDAHAPASEASLMAPGFTLLSTILAFKLIPFFLARLVVGGTALALIYAFSPAALSKSITPGNYRRTFAMYVSSHSPLDLAVN